MKALMLVAAALMLLGAIMLVTGFGASLLWKSVITIGIALVVINQVRSTKTQ